MSMKKAIIERPLMLNYLGIAIKVLYKSIQCPVCERKGAISQASFGAKVSVFLHD